MENALAALEKLSKEVGALSHQYHGRVPLTDDQIATYTSVMNHVRDETDKIYDEMQALVPAQMRERFDSLWRIVGEVESFRCFAGTPEQNDMIKQVYRATVNRGVQEREQFTPYDPKYALVHAMSNHFPAKRRSELE